MKSVVSYFITIIAVFYWIFRVVVCLMASMGREFICEPYNNTLEIVILFLTIPGILFVIRRNVIGATLYFGMYAAYFGTILYEDFLATQSFDLMNSTSMLFTALGVVIPFIAFCDVLIGSRGGYAKNKEDWYYGKGNHEREYDERADRNQYKIK